MIMSGYALFHVLVKNKLSFVPTTRRKARLNVPNSIVPRHQELLPDTAWSANGMTPPRLFVFNVSVYIPPVVLVMVLLTPRAVEGAHPSLS